MIFPPVGLASCSVYVLNMSIIFEKRIGFNAAMLQDCTLNLNPLKTGPIHFFLRTQRE
jgi:hypothetical protein